MSNQVKIEIGNYHHFGSVFSFPSLSYSGILNSTTFAISMAQGYSSIPLYFSMDTKEIAIKKTKLKVIEVTPLYIILEKID